jgi:hypothetical protein
MDDDVECATTTNAFCDGHDCAPTYAELLEISETWNEDCNAFAPEVGPTITGRFYGTCGDGRVIAHIRESGADAYYFDSTGAFIGVYVSNSTGDEPYCAGTPLDCTNGETEYLSCALGVGGAGGESN